MTNEEWVEFTRQFTAEELSERLNKSGFHSIDPEFLDHWCYDYDYYIEIASQYKADSISELSGILQSREGWEATNVREEWWRKISKEYQLYRNSRLIGHSSEWALHIRSTLEETYNFFMDFYPDMPEKADEELRIELRHRTGYDSNLALRYLKFQRDNYEGLDDAFEYFNMNSFLAVYNSLDTSDDNGHDENYRFNLAACYEKPGPNCFDELRAEVYSRLIKEGYSQKDAIMYSDCKMYDFMYFVEDENFAIDEARQYVLDNYGLPISDCIKSEKSKFILYGHGTIYNDSIDFLGWGGPDSTDAIFRINDFSILSKKIAIFFNKKELAIGNENVQAQSGSGFSVKKIIPESSDGNFGIIIMESDYFAIKESIKVGQNKVECDHAIALYCRGDLDITIATFDKNNIFKVIYSQGFMCR